MNQLVALNPQQSQIATVPSFTMSDMERVALAIAKGGLFGSTDPNAVLTLCMLAQAEGQHPAVVFRDYHIINNKPAKKAEAMHRDFLAAGGRIEWHQCDDDCADATFSHPQGGSMRITWDSARVAQAQLGGNPMHKKYPRQMKRSRVISEGVRAVFPMATSGLYETGEVQDIVAQDGPTSPAVPEAKRARDIKAVEDKGRANAEEWVLGQIATVENAADTDALDTIIQGGSKAVAKLARSHADLHDQVQAAYAKRTAELQGYNSDTGEIVNDAPPDFLARISSAADPADLGLVEQDYREVMADLPKAQADEIEAALVAKREALAGEG